ncbi:hypothetical protein [Seonamhaeicola sp.]|uniref:WD40/YVTN/BNR-like repeat-containing protein n=1 Tax=Seonamhaeicola sp. TaxID=1912245 RepID=UPI00260D2C88|nr:hypothetical protein [Seonamhaeicola sp.]
MQNKLILSLLILMVSGFSLNAQSPIDFSKIDKKKIVSDPSVQWTQFGPGSAGNNYHIYWHPTDPNTVFHGPNMGNSYRSTNRGETYTGVMDPDGPGYRSWERGPVEIYSPEFSHQDENFGICTMEGASHIYTTTNKGLTWEKNDAISSQFKGIHINTIEVDPTDDNIWYAGSGNIRDFNHFFHTYKNPHGVFGSKTVVGKGSDGKVDYGHKSRIWKSTDKGQTWKDITPKGIAPLAQITRIFVHPGKPNVLFTPTTYGFYKSTNAGKTWQLKKEVGFDNNIIRSMDMHFDTKTKKVTLYAIDLVKYIPNGKSMTYNGGIYKSTDEGERWTNINHNMPLEKAVLKSAPIKKSYYKIALSKWFGKTDKEVTKLYPELPEKMMHSVSLIRVNPKNPDHVLVINNYKSQFTFQGGMLWRTDNGGKDWYVTLRNGKNWEGKDKVLWQARGNETSHNVNWVSQGEWEKRDLYDRKAGAVVEFNSDGTTIMCQVAKVVCVSNNNGDSWLENDEKETVLGSHHWVGAGDSNLPGAELVQDMRLKNHFYLCSGENSIWKTTNDGDLVRPGAQAVYKLSIPNKEKPAECSVGTMAIHPRDTNTLYSLHFRQAFFGKLMKSTNAGETWEPHGSLFNPKAFGNPVSMSIPQNHLRIDPDYPNRFYCVIAKKRVTSGGGGGRVGKFKAYGVYRSTDGGVNFQIINKGLPAKGNVQKLELDPNNKGVVYAAVSGSKNAPGGVYKLEDGANEWQAISIPKGMISVNDLYFSTDNELYISGGTWGGKANAGGVWSYGKGKKWKQVFPYSFTNHIRVAKYDPKVLLLTIPSHAAPGILNPGIYRSLDKGKTWAKINAGNIQSDRIVDIQIDYHNPGIYWCSTYGAGFYKAIDKN